MLKKCGSCLLPLKACRATTPGKQKKKRLFTAPLHTTTRRQRGWLDSYLQNAIRSIQHALYSVSPTNCKKTRVHSPSFSLFFCLPEPITRVLVIFCPSLLPEFQSFFVYPVPRLGALKLGENLFTRVHSPSFSSPTPVPRVLVIPFLIVHLLENCCAYFQGRLGRTIALS